MEANRLKVFAALVVVASVLWVSPAWAGGLSGSLGAIGGGGAGFGALSSLKNMISGNIATVAAIAVLGIGMLLAFSKSSWMELVGSLSFMATLGIAISWAANNTSSFFGSGGLVV